MDKYQQLHPATNDELPDPTTGISTPVMDRVLQMLTRSYKNRFLVKAGEHIKTIPVDQINFFYSMGKATFLNSSENKEYDIDYTLEELETLLNPEQFFRINRKFIIAVKSIKDIINYTNSRLKLRLLNSTDDDIIVSREKVTAFKGWLDQ